MKFKEWNTGSHQGILGFAAGIVVGLMFLLLVSGCVTMHQFRAYSEVDPIQKAYIHKGVNIEVGNDIPTANIWLNAAVIVYEDTMNYFMTVVYEARTWMFIRSGNSLILIIDGEEIKLYSPAGSLNSRHVGGRPSIWARGGSEVTTWEEAVYVVSRPILEKIAHGKMIIARLYGDDMSPYLTFTDKSKNQMRKFLDYFYSVANMPGFLY